MEIRFDDNVELLLGLELVITIRMNMKAKYYLKSASVLIGDLADPPQDSYFQWL